MKWCQSMWVGAAWALIGSGVVPVLRGEDQPAKPAQTAEKAADGKAKAKTAEKAAAAAEAKAQDAEKEGPEVVRKREWKKEVKVFAVPADSKLWIGVQATPIQDDALKTQLNLKEDGLIVRHVLPDSPAQKAEIQPHDVLIRFGDQPLETVEDLVKSVDAAGEKETKLELIRGGKKLTVTIVPTSRPEKVTGAQLLRHELKHLQPDVEHQDGKSIYSLRVLGPGIAASQAFAASVSKSPFPDGLSLTVSKEEGQPAKIYAKQDGKTYEATADDLSKLPESIRTQVEHWINPKSIMMVGPHHMKGLELNLDAAKIRAEVEQAVQAAQQHKDQLRARSEDELKTLRNKVEVRRLEGGPLDEVRKELEALRKEIQQLKTEKNAPDTDNDKSGK